jgi:hypothetical protein
MWSADVKRLESHVCDVCVGVRILRRGCLIKCRIVRDVLPHENRVR